MPEIEDRVITRAWRLSDQPDRIHFVVVRPDGTDPQMFADPGDPLHDVLDAHLRQQGCDPPVPPDHVQGHPEQGH